MVRIGGWAVAFGRFWWGFVIGDDWTVAAAVVGALGLTAVLLAVDVPAWWVLPLVVVVALTVSVRRVERRRSD